MGTKYNDYLDNSTKKLLEIMAMQDIDTEEKEAIVSSFSGVLSKGITNTDELPEYEYIINKTMLVYLDERLTQIVGNDAACKNELELALQYCKRGAGLMELFAAKGWLLPPLKHENMAECAGRVSLRIEAGALVGNVLETDAKITEAFQKGKKEPSVAGCNSLSVLLDKLSDALKLCEEKGIICPQLNNSNIDKNRVEIEKLKAAGQKREKLLNDIYETDLQIDSYEAMPRTTKEQWESVLRLCERQKSLLDECLINQWQIPALRQTEFTSIISKYTHYLLMAQIDDAMQPLTVENFSKIQYEDFRANCMKQVKNIVICEKNGWSIPELKNPKPDVMLASADKLNHKRGLIKKVKMYAVMTGIGIIAIAVLIVLGINKFREGKCQIPFEAVYATGEELDSIVDELEDAGFSNIHTVPDYSGWEADECVISVAVDNESEFEKDDYFDPDVTITIKYSSTGRVDISELLSGWQKQDYESVVETIKGAGFSKVTVKEVDTSEIEKNRLISEIKLNEIAYVNGRCHIPKDAPVEITFYTLKLNIGNTNSSFRGQDYETVVEGLRSIGFTNVCTEVVYSGLAKGRSVVGVTVNNSTDYAVNSTYVPDVRIVVRYSSEERIDATSCLKDWSTLDYRKTQTALKTAGFNNVRVNSMETRDSKLNQKTNAIRVNDELYVGGDCYVQKGTLIEISYYNLVIEMSKKASDYEKEQYSSVVEELKSCGFTNIVLKRSNDLINGWVTKEGSIKSISIDGDSNFKAKATFNYDAEIVIVVNTFKNKGCEDIIVIAD